MEAFEFLEGGERGRVGALTCVSFLCCSGGYDLRGETSALCATAAQVVPGKVASGDQPLREQPAG